MKEKVRYSTGSFYIEAGFYTEDEILLLLEAMKKREQALSFSWEEEAE